MHQWQWFDLQNLSNGRASELTSEPATVLFMCQYMYTGKVGTNAPVIPIFPYRATEGGNLVLGERVYSMNRGRLSLSMVVKTAVTMAMSNITSKRQNYTCTRLMGEEKRG